MDCLLGGITSHKLVNHTSQLASLEPFDSDYFVGQPTSSYLNRVGIIISDLD